MAVQADATGQPATAARNWYARSTDEVTTALGVDPATGLTAARAEELLAAHGPVSPETAAALAEGIRARCGASWGIGLTGVAGPDPVDGYGPGRVYLGVADGRRTDVAELDLPGDRQAVRTGAVRAALEQLLARLAGNAVAERGVTP